MSGHQRVSRNPIQWYADTYFFLFVESQLMESLVYLV